MKAKHINKIRSQFITYLIERSYRMFGSFSYDLRDYDEVMARNPKEAVKRYCKRTHSTKDLGRYDETPDQTNETFGKFIVLPKDKPYDRFVTYWK